MKEDYVATSTITIDAKPAVVWSVITDPVATKEFMFGTDVVTDWVVGGSIRWRGMWEGREYEDKGEILELVPGRRLVTTAVRSPVKPTSPRTTTRSRGLSRRPLSRQS